MSSLSPSKKRSYQCGILIGSVDLGRYLDGNIPEALVETVRKNLAVVTNDELIKGNWLTTFGPDLHIQMTSYPRSRTHTSQLKDTILRLGVAAIEEALKQKLCADEAKHIVNATSDEQTQALGLRFTEFPYTERRAEPIFVAKAINASWGFFNRALFNLFFNPDKGSGHRIEGNYFLGVVESIQDLAEGKPEVRTYEFGPGYINDMLALIADAEQWRLSQIYAVRGKFGEGSLKNEPAALVEGSFNPVMVGRSQSGLPAIGEFTQVSGEFYFGPGGPGGNYQVGLMPADFEQAGVSSPDGAAKVVAYAYQSFGKGSLPPDADIVDVFSQNRPETLRLQQESAQLIKQMVSHGEFEPYLSSTAATARALGQAEKLAERFTEIPKESDPLVETANRRAQFTLSDIKADAGGKVGHTSPPNHFKGVAEASLQESKDAGLIFGTSAFMEVGDDEHLLMSHSRGADNNEIHLFAYRTFFRQVWVAKVLGYQWYGLGQDLIGEASANKSTEEIAHLTEAFIKLLPNYLPPAERSRMNELEEAYKRWASQGVAGEKVELPFAGNVSGQGPGFAELPLRRNEKIGLLAIDKAGPSAFNLPIWRSLNQSTSNNSLWNYLDKIGGKGIVLEIWDVEHHHRVFLDFEKEGRIAQKLLGAIEKFNVKRIWSRTSEKWDPSQLSKSLDNILMAASTEKLSVISGGEYLGKDDPVLLAVEPLAQALNLFMRDNFYLTQGDGRGSHFMFPTPLPFDDAIATINSRAVAVSAWINLDASGEIRGFHDVFADGVYERARDRAYHLNKTIWNAHGGNFTPVGVGADKVEQSYPLAKTIARITAPDSQFATNRISRR